MEFLHDVIAASLSKQKRAYDPKNPPDYASSRAQIQSVTVGLYRKPTIDIDEKGEFLSLPDNPKDRVVYYIHGGGFCRGEPKQRRMFTEYMVRKFKLDVYAVDYALAPEHPYPAGLNDCVAAYEWLLAKYDPKKVVLIGESAGGNLVVATLLELAKRNLPMPASFVVISPTLQCVEASESFHKNNPTDCMVDGPTILQELQDMYFREHDSEILSKPEYSPLYGDFAPFPPGYVLVSDSETLYDDSIAFHKRMLETGKRCDLEIGHGKMHAWVIIPYFRSAKRALRSIKKYINQTIQEANA